MLRFLNVFIKLKIMSSSAMLYSRRLGGRKNPIATLLKDAIINLCKVSKIYDGCIEIDAIICISGNTEGQQLVVKVHENFQPQDNRRSNEENNESFGDSLEYKEETTTVCDNELRYPFERKRQRYESKPEMAKSSAVVKQYNIHPETVSSSHSFEVDCANGAEDLSMKNLSALSHHSKDMVDVASNNNHSSFPCFVNSPTVSHQMVELQVPFDESESLLGKSMFHSTLRDVGSKRWNVAKGLPEILECRVCGYGFDGSEALSDHNEAMHSLFTCLCCLKTFTSRSNLERHSRLHTGHKPYMCGICGKAFSRKDHLSNHATKHAFKCSTCSKRYADHSSLISHYQIDHAASLTNICSYCNKGFCSQELYEDHVKIHPQFHLTASDTLDESASGRQEAASHHSSKSRRHSKLKTGNNLVGFCKRKSLEKLNSLFTCLICGQTFDSHWQYNSHLSVHPNDYNIFKCSVCLQICSSLSHLRQHEALHFGALSEYLQTASLGSYSCNNCEQSFDNLFRLQVHLEDHQKVNQVLQKVNRTSLEDHLHSYQTYVEDQQCKNFVCFQCGMNFTDHDSLQQHEKEANHTQSAGIDTKLLKRDKRKQMKPKPAMIIEENGDDESEIEVVDTELSIQENQRGSDVAQNKENLKNKIENKEGNIEIRCEPVQKLMNRPLMQELPTGWANHNGNSTSLASENASVLDLMDKHLMAHCKKDFACLESEGGTNDGDSVPSHVQRSALKHTSELLTSDSFRLSEGSLSLKLYQSSEECRSSSTPSDSGCLNSSSLQNGNSLSGINIPSRPYLCAFCDLKSETFADLDIHCQMEHSRSPCMFCDKTFAQKANRDRHHCLHTGDKPYGCPECEERFSRGDKLKMHRLRVHGVQYPAYSSRQKDTSSAPSGQNYSPVGLVYPYDFFSKNSFLNGFQVTEGFELQEDDQRGKKIPGVIGATCQGECSDEDRNDDSDPQSLPMICHQPNVDSEAVNHNASALGAS